MLIIFLYLNESRFLFSSVEVTFNETLIETLNAYLNARLNGRPHEEGLWLDPIILNNSWFRGMVLSSPTFLVVKSSYSQGFFRQRKLLALEFIRFCLFIKFLIFKRTKHMQSHLKLQYHQIIQHVNFHWLFAMPIKIEWTNKLWLVTISPNMVMRHWAYSVIQCEPHCELH